jgi:hypothetical protein
MKWSKSMSMSMRCGWCWALGLLVLGVALPARSLAEAPVAEDGWLVLFDGSSLDDWKAGENPQSWSLQDGLLVCFGPRSHLFYVGEHQPFTSFHFQAEVKTMPGANSGIYFHTKYQESGWPTIGYECQVNITHGDWRKSGGLYAVDDVRDPPAKDEEWYTQEIIVQGKRILCKINGQVVVDYVEPDELPARTDGFQRNLSSGTFALQAHDPESRVYFRNIMVKKLDD